MPMVLKVPIWNVLPIRVAARNINATVLFQGSLSVHNLKITHRLHYEVFTVLAALECLSIYDSINKPF